MVMGLVLELQQPFLHCPVNIHIHINAACIVLLAHLHIVQKPFALEITGTYRRDIHQAERLVLPSELLADLQIEVICPLNLILDERVLDSDIIQYGGESGVAAMVAPVCIQYPELCLIRVAAFVAEIFHDLAEIVRIHCKPVFFAIRGKFIFPELPQSFKHRHGTHWSVLHIAEP